MERTKNANQSHPVIVRDECKGCGRCINACPKKCLQFSTKPNAKSYVPAEYKGENCIGCGICFYNCPEPYAIQVYKKGKE